MERRLGALERQLFAYTQMRGIREVRTGDLAEALGITRKQERELLTRSASSGMIAKVRRGLYLVPSRLPLGGRWTPDEGLVLNTLMADRGGQYQVCGPSAFSRYGYIDQLPTRVHAYNDRSSEERTVGAVTVHLIKVAEDRLGETELVTGGDSEPIVYGSRVRTLFDAVYDWSRFNSLPRAYDWIGADLAAGRVTAPDLVRVTLRYGNISTIRRIGALLEGELAAESLLRKLERGGGRLTNVIPWIPSGSEAGATNRRWGVRVNEPA